MPGWPWTVPKPSDSRAHFAICGNPLADRKVTQSQLAKALSSEGRVAGPTLSSWESLTNPKTPSVARVSAYARFCTERSLQGEPHLIPEDQLTPEELDRFQELESRLLRRFHAEEPKLQHIFRFAVGPVMLSAPMRQRRCGDRSRKRMTPISRSCNSTEIWMRCYSSMGTCARRILPWTSYPNSRARSYRTTIEVT